MLAAPCSAFTMFSLVVDYYLRGLTIMVLVDFLKMHTTMLDLVVVLDGMNRIMMQIIPLWLEPMVTLTPMNSLQHTFPIPIM